MRILLLSASLLAAAASHGQCTLTIVLEYTRPPVPGAQVKVVVANDPHCFEFEENCKVEKADAFPPTTRIEIPDLPPGVYALKCYIDQNDNGKLDIGWNNTPTEPHGFSNNATGRSGLPYFADATFQLHEGTNVHRVTIH